MALPTFGTGRSSTVGTGCALQSVQRHPGPLPTDAINTPPVLMAHSFSRHCRSPLGAHVAPAEGRGTAQSMLINLKCFYTRSADKQLSPLLVIVFFFFGGGVLYPLNRQLSSFSAITKYHRQDGLNNRNLFSPQLWRLEV